MVANRAAIGRARRERTRAALVEAALAVFARLGPDAPSIDDFTSEAALARGTFYNFFESREDLLIAVAITVAERIEAELAPLRSCPDPAERLAGAVRGYIRKAASDPVWGWAVVRIALVAAPLGTTMRSNLTRDLTEGTAIGRFRLTSVAAAQDLVLGAGLMGMRSVLVGDVKAEHAECVAQAILMALGVADAADVVARPLPLM
ncbi:MAG: TetR/AcrR family transcriptional regulator [Roseomonas sp.]|nr:TetR/AcrR family transcriptional regulator [Roseomonas sp.]